MNRLRQAKFSASKILTSASLFAAMTLNEPLHRDGSVTPTLEIEKEYLYMSRFLTWGYGIHQPHWWWHYHLWLILHKMQPQADSNSGQKKINIRKWSMTDYNRAILMNGDSCFMPPFRTLQISSPWKPPATIKFSLTVIVLICTLESDCPKDPGHFCMRNQSRFSLQFSSEQN